MMLRESEALVAAVAAGIISHHAIFIRGEHHVQAPKLLRFYIVVTFLIYFGKVWSSAKYLQATRATAFIILSYVTALFASVIIYRISLHRLRRFPGPLMARVTKFWHVFQLLDKPNFRLLDELHQKYGDYVRIGPNEISIRKAEAVSQVHGPGSKCTKAPFYDLLLPRVSIITTRSKPSHDQRRRIWDHAFSTKALNQYEVKVMEHCAELEGHLANSAGLVVDASSWFHYFAFDVMGELSFGKSFNMLETGKEHFAIDMMRDGMTLLGLFTPTPWLARIGFSIPGIASGWKKMFVWSDEQMRQRIAIKEEQTDITSWLISASKANDSLEEDRHWLNGDAFGIIIAGSDTTASTLVFIFYHLAQSPNHVEKLRTELANSPSVLDARLLQSLPHLNGFINETLRLHPPVPSAGLRESPPDGLVIAGQYIPGNTIIDLPVYTLHRRLSPSSPPKSSATDFCLVESCFERALDFIPERWSSSPELVKDKSAFIPFFQGRFGCVGKNLALMEIRAVMASLVQKYDISFAPGTDNGASVIRDAKDQFTITPGKLELVFTPLI